MGIQRVNQTISYYDNNAEAYFEQTKDADFSGIYDRFLEYIPDGGTIADLGCGSGRDTAYFVSQGYKAFGVDASRELAEIAIERLDINIQIANISNWVSTEPLDGIWCCASLLHLDNGEIRSFFNLLPGNLKQGGVAFISVKTGIETGIDDKGRYVRNFTLDDIESQLSEVGLRIKESWNSTDKIGRKEIRWINIIAIKDKDIN